MKKISILLLLLMLGVMGMTGAIGCDKEKPQEILTSEEIIEKYKEASKKNPHDLSIAYNMALIYDNKLDDPEAAFSYYSHYLDLARLDDPDRSKVKKWRDDCLKRMVKNEHIGILGVPVSEINRIQGEVYSPLLKEKRKIDLGQNVKPLVFFVPSSLESAYDFLFSLTYAEPAKEIPDNLKYRSTLKFTLNNGASKELYLTDDYVTVDKKIIYRSDDILLLLDMGTAPYHPMTNTGDPEWFKIKTVTPKNFFPYILNSMAIGDTGYVAFEHAFRGGGKGSWHYQRQLIKKISTKIKSAKSVHDMSKLAGFLGKLSARKEIIGLLAEEKWHDCCYIPRLIQSLAQCGRIEDAPVLIKRFDYPAEGGSEVPVINAALCRLTHLKVKWSKKEWQKWWEDNKDKYLKDPK